MTLDKAIEFFDRKKKETIDRLVGKDAKCIVPNNRVSLKSKIKTVGKDENYSYNLAPRQPSIAATNSWLYEYNFMNRTNHGKIVTYVEEASLADEVPPPIK